MTGAAGRRGSRTASTLGLWSLAVWCAAILASCTTYFRPVVAHRAESRSGVRGELQEVGLFGLGAGELGVEAELRLPEGGHADGVRLALLHGPPCQSGIAGWLEPLDAPANTRERRPVRRRAMFSAEPARKTILSWTNAVDFRLSGPGASQDCLRIPLVQGGRGVEWAASNKWFHNMGFTGMFAVGPSALSGPAAGGSTRIGAWVSQDARAWLEIGAVGSKHEKLPLGQFPIGLATDTEIARRGRSSVRAYAGYHLWPGLRGPDSPEAKATAAPLYHGPRAGLILSHAAGFDVPLGFDLGLRLMTFDLDLPVSLLLSHAQGTQATLVFGLAAGMTFGL